MKILIINGPNLNLLGTREPEVYGTETLLDIENYLKQSISKTETQIEFYQSNIEGELVNKIQSAQNSFDGLIINPAAYSHTSIAMHDALKTLKIPIIEVHLSNTHSREDFRQQLITAKAAKSVIAGQGKEGYSYALNYIMKGNI
jgi:3-dehydroquinate dehydratase-2